MWRKHQCKTIAFNRLCRQNHWNRSRRCRTSILAKTSLNKLNITKYQFLKDSFGDSRRFFKCNPNGLFLNKMNRPLAVIWLNTAMANHVQSPLPEITIYTCRSSWCLRKTSSEIVTFIHSAWKDLHLRYIASTWSWYNKDFVHDFSNQLAIWLSAPCQPQLLAFLTFFLVIFLLYFFGFHSCFFTNVFLSISMYLFTCLFVHLFFPSLPLNNLFPDFPSHLALVSLFFSPRSLSFSQAPFFPCLSLYLPVFESLCILLFQIEF